MLVSKLDYLIKNLSVADKNRFIVEMDPNGEYNFGFLDVEFLKNPDSKDPFVLLAIPGYDCDLEYENCINLINNYKQKYVKIFENINNLCIQYKIKPFFNNPTNLVECELTREDLCAEVHESILNKFFKTESYYSYYPPLYEP